MKHLTEPFKVQYRTFFSKSDTLMGELHWICFRVYHWRMEKCCWHDYDIMWFYFLSLWLKSETEKIEQHIYSLV